VSLLKKIANPGAVMLIAAFCMASGVQASTTTLTSNNSSVVLSTGPLTGNAGNSPFITDWVVDGVDQYGNTATNGEFLEIANAGTAGEMHVLAPTDISQTAASFTATYILPDVSFTLNEALTGGAIGSGTSNLVETMTMLNTSSSTTLSPAFVSEAFPNIASDPTGSLTLSPTGSPNTATATDNSGTTIKFVASPTPGMASTIVSTTGYMFDFQDTLQPGDSATITMDETVTGAVATSGGGSGTTAIPLPNAGATSVTTLLAISLVGLARKRGIASAGGWF
jgi:hypothetical protein